MTIRASYTTQWGTIDDAPVGPFDGAVCLLPESLAEAEELLNENPGASLLSGTTDIVPDMRNGRFTAQKITRFMKSRVIRICSWIGENQNCLVWRECHTSPFVMTTPPSFPKR